MSGSNPLAPVQAMDPNWTNPNPLQQGPSLADVWQQHYNDYQNWQAQQNSLYQAQHKLDVANGLFDPTTDARTDKGWGALGTEIGKAYGQGMLMGSVAPGEGVPLYKSGEAAKSLNFKLREGLQLNDADKTVLSDTQARMQPLQTDQTLWRGLSGSQFHDAPIGSILNDPGLVSTSPSMSQASVFAAHPNPTMLRIQAQSGTPALDMNGHMESEVVLPHGHDYQVTDRVQVPGRYTIVGVKMMPKPQVAQ